MAASPTELSRAAQANLDRVLEEEQRRLARSISAIRVAFTVTGALLFLVVPDEHGHQIDVSRYGAMAYAAVALVLFSLTRVPRLHRLVLWATPVIDVPLLSALHLEQRLHLDQPLLIVPANAAMMTGLVVLAALTLDWVIIAATALAAAISVGLMGTASQLPPMVIGLLLIVPPAVAVGCSTLVVRIRRLVRESRRRDLLGKYVLGQRIGTGGMAEVFEATYCPEGGFERRVAIKRILPSFAQNAESVALFRREAELGSALAHPGLVHVLDFGRDSDTYFIAMEYVDGCTLAEVLRTLRAESPARQLPVEAVATLAWTLADALDYIHEHLSSTGAPQRLVHRDVNPPNVLLTRAGDVKLSDFGVAREVDDTSITRAGIMRGKLAYAAPEQVSGAPFDGRADLFALGVTLWECLAGARPFQGDDAVLVRRILEDDVAPITSIRPDVPEVLATSVMRLLVRDPLRRTPSARHLVRDLAALSVSLVDLREGKRQLARLVNATIQGRTTAEHATEGAAVAGALTKTAELPTSG